MSTLLVVSSAPATRLDEKLSLDVKFVEGMRYYAAQWDGPIRCILKLRETALPFGQTYDLKELPFDVALVPADREICLEDIQGHDVILCSGDNHRYLHLADGIAQTDSKLVYIIEYIPETRRQITFLDPSVSLMGKAYMFFWILWHELRRRSAFRKADGIQANGYPAFSHYKSLGSETTLYLDNRIGEALLATEAEMAARAARLRTGEPLRLLHSGRLEALKGSQDLIPVARQRAAKGVDFTLDIFGTGSLKDEIRAGIAEHGLQDRVRLNGVVDFETELVPFAREHADIYLSCHRQSDPSCTYIENMGCGLAVIGYANRMWSALSQDSQAGWVAPLGNHQALADAICEAAQDRTGLMAKCHAARAFAKEHSFENEFHRRIVHLKKVSGA